MQASPATQATHAAAADDPSALAQYSPARHPDAASARLCVDCVHAKPVRGLYTASTVMVCVHPANGFSLIDGKPISRKAADARHPRHDDATQCGEAGRWFSPSASGPQCPSQQT